jgi:putative membrane protein
MNRMLLIALLAVACSRDTVQHAHPQPPTEPAPSATLSSQDRDFLERAAEGGNAEVAIGTLAPERAARAEVVAFAQMLVADHRAANQQLAAIAAAKHITLPKSLGDQQQGFDRLVDERRENFDREFAKVTIDDHHQAIELYRGEAANGTDPELKAFAAAKLPTLEAHLARAIALSAP